MTEQPSRAGRREPGLYDPAFEHDACGVGFVADTGGRRRSDVLPLALAGLGSLRHRGAFAADGESSDGAGVALPLELEMLRRIAPHDLLVRGAGDTSPSGRARRSGAGGPSPGVVMCFLPRDRTGREKARGIVQDAVSREGLSVAAWRDVPVDPAALGREARRDAPHVAQAFVVERSARGTQQRTRARIDAFERSLIIARRRMEQAAREVPLTDFAVASASSRTVVYKGLVAGDALARYYLDLASPVGVSYAVFHQRYATNTTPGWNLAQPFRYLAHNGEVNTVRGNRLQIAGRRAALGAGALGRRLVDAGPLLDPAGSDSLSLDEALELLVLAGWSVEAAMLALVPESLALRGSPHHAVRLFQARTAPLLAPWDGPAALVFSDGRRVGALLDRNGLRPAAYVLTHDGLVALASEAGAVPISAGQTRQRGRLGPGEMLLVDPGRGLVLDDTEAKQESVARHVSIAPEARVFQDRTDRTDRPDVDSRDRANWAGADRAGADQVHPAATDPGKAPDAMRPASVTGHAPTVHAGRMTGHGVESVAAGESVRRWLAGLDAERLRLDVRTMALEGHEALWSMGDDTPLPGLARRDRPVADHLRQSFAQVTNPPIDPDRERIVMEMRVELGRRPRLLGRLPGRSGTLRLARPFVADLAGLCTTFASGRPGGAARIRTLDATWDPTAGTKGLAAALDRLAADALRAAGSGIELLIVSHRRLGPDALPVPMVLAVGAIHTTLIRAGLRGQTDLLADAADVLDVHTSAMVLACGATAICPRLAIELAAEMAGGRGGEDLTSERAVTNLLTAFEAGLRKTLARMGISTAASYVGGSFFEVLELTPEVAERCFPRAPLRPGTVDLEALAARQLRRRAAVAGLGGRERLPDPGLIRFRADGEAHLYAPPLVKAIQSLVQGPDDGTTGPSAAGDLTAYRLALARDPALVRDQLELRTGVPVPLGEVEPAELIVRRFVSSAMSLGSLSPEAHQALTIGMRMAGGASNTGEGGEDPAWYVAEPDGARRDSAIKQVASARFGVTAEYLSRAEQLEIKIAQGSKPGEGGQLPGRKATALIAALRRAQPGQSLISPPPHHDIYSIEDLAQLIADLRAINPEARIGVKLVAAVGVGTIAAGVAKAGADYVQISGHAGGTGASPLRSIKHVGIPWELGLAEAHQTLLRNGLRDRVALRTDGGLQTGRDVLVAALLGAEEFGFGTAALVSLGCDMARQCHLDTCPTGIATQREDLRQKFSGRPEDVARFFLAIAEDVRAELAALGARSLGEVIGAADRLAPAPGNPTLDLAGLLGAPAWEASVWRRANPARSRDGVRRHPASPLEEQLVADLLEQRSLPGVPASPVMHVAEAEVSTADRSLGARVSGVQARNPTLRPVRWRFRGSAGQSFGAYAGPGVELELVGQANDYVGKGLSGGVLRLMPEPALLATARQHAIAGNTCLYGATGGRLHVVGRAGMRFAVRNSGAEAVVEGVGPHGCEYMTGGLVVILGPVGRNFGAGMTGGRAFLHDPDGRRIGALDGRSVQATRLSTLVDTRPDGSSLVAELGLLLVDHARLGSVAAADLVEHWPGAVDQFWLVEPVSAEVRDRAAEAVTAKVLVPPSRVVATLPTATA